MPKDESFPDIQGRGPIPPFTQLHSFFPLRQDPLSLILLG